MATVYFTNNADSGDGSLRAAISAAASGDIVTYSDSAFADTDEIVIPLSSALVSPTTKDITIDGRKKRIVLDGQRVSLLLKAGTTNQSRVQNFINIDFINGYSDSYKAPVNIARVSAMFKGCRILGSTTVAMNTGIYAEYQATFTMVDCLVSGCRRVGVNIGDSVFNEVIIKRCTIVGNEIDISINNTNTANSITDCLIHTKTGPGSADIITTLPSTCGFVAPCPDTIDPESWTNTLWQSWDFRLTPESPYLTGAETSEGEVDVLGHTRKVNGAIGAYEGSWVVGGQTITEDTTVDYCDFKPGNTVTFTGEDRFLSVTKVAYIDGATFTAAEGATGYAAFPAGTDISAATFSGVKTAIYGAGASDFHAQVTSPTTASLSWSQTDSDVPVLVEAQESESDTWTTLSTSATSPYTVTDDDIGYLTFRIFDGENFYTAAGSYTFAKFYQVVAGYVPRNNDTTPHSWQTLIKLLTVNEMNENLRPGQDCAILARVYDAFDNDSPLLNVGINIESVHYTCEKKTKGLYTTEWAPVTGHNNVSAGADCVLSSLQTDDAWDLDNVGYNFLLSPEIRDYPLFETTGLYRIKATINLVDGDPITFYKGINVVE